MQAVAEKNILKLVSNNESIESISSLLNALESADQKMKNEIENKIVAFGANAVPELVKHLQSVKGVKRGVIAMSLIRIGYASISYLKHTMEKNADFAWIAQYLITEIEGSRQPIGA